MAKLRTLGDVRQTGLELVAVCHNVNCRASKTIDLGALIDAVGALQSLLPVRGQLHFSERMRCSRCGHRGVFIWIEVPKTPDPAFNSLLNFRVLAFDRITGRALTDVLRASDRRVAQAGFDVAEAVFPQHRLEMSFQGQTIRSSHLTAIKGGKE